jgi:hypothetical protein
MKHRIGLITMCSVVVGYTEAFIRTYHGVDYYAVSFVAGIDDMGGGLGVRRAKRGGNGGLIGRVSRAS